MVNWKSSESFSRLLAATVASIENQKLDYRKIATFYGEGATYDAIEGRFRVIRKEAQKLKEEVNLGVRPEAPKRGEANSNPTTPRKPKTPRKDGVSDGVASGRITKKSSTSFGSSTSNTPTKRRSTKQPVVKTEVLDLTGNESYESSAPSVDTPTSSMLMEQQEYHATNNDSTELNEPMCHAPYLASNMLTSDMADGDAMVHEDNFGFFPGSENDYHLDILGEGIV